VPALPTLHIQKTYSLSCFSPLQAMQNGNSSPSPISSSSSSADSPISPPPPPSPSHYPISLVDELYKCGHPPPSYSTAIGAADATPVQSRQQTREIIIAPFGGTLCHVIPLAVPSRSASDTSSCHPIQPPPAYNQLDRRERRESSTGAGGQIWGLLVQCPWIHSYSG
jgi:hypothetical protein